MDYEIEVGGTSLPLLTSVKIKKDVTKLTDTAEIVCPAVAHSRPLAYVAGLAKWQPVTVKLGYDGKLNTEFVGYVKSVVLQDNLVTLECEDAILLLQRVQLPDAVMKDTTLEKVLTRTLEHVNAFILSEGLGSPITLDCVYSYGYDKFTFANVTAYDVLDKVQKEGFPNISMDGRTMRIYPQYTNPSGLVDYSLSRNICRGGLKLKWRDENDRKLRIEVRAIKADGTDITTYAGKKGGDVFRMEFKHLRTQEDLQRIADNTYNRKVYTGYEGSFEAWLVPFCDVNYSVRLIDESESLRSGVYYVPSMEVEFSSSGGVRRIGVGRVSR